MNILVLSNNYPNRKSPNYGAFVYNLMQELSKKNKISIIAPFKVHLLFHSNVASYGDENCNVLRPYLFSFSRFKRLNHFFYRRTINKTLRKIKNKPDVIYVHFLNKVEFILDYAEKYNIPIVVASGESTYTSWTKLSVSLQNRIKHQISHVICVSNDNKERLLKLGFQESKLTVVPNAVNYELFKPLNKAECKERLNITKDRFVVGFIGHFTHRKGPDRVIQAIKMLKNENITLICVGRGEKSLEENTFTKELNPLPNFKLPDIYNAFDVFVLPTLNEGHCNVIEEAKACGIPIISSKGTSVEEQIDESVGILVAPMKIEEISSAIQYLISNPNALENMEDNLIKLRGSNSLKRRSEIINGILLDVVK